MADKFVSHYRIIEKIGAGGMGVVYKAEDTKLGRTVALKFLPDVSAHESDKQRFLHEAQTASVLDHPNICNIYEINETDEGEVYIAMAFYDGDSLRERIAREPMPPRETFEIIYSIADGLAAAHEKGVVHRDIKPANVIVTTQGFVKILDFGLAKLAGRTRLTRTGISPGTLAYMSPQQIKGEDVDQRTDIWALGVLAYEALTGELPFQADMEAAVMYQVLNDDPLPIRERRGDIPNEFAAIIHKCLEKNPEQRYQSANELINALAEVAKQHGWQSSGAVRSAIRVGRSASQRRRGMTGAMGALVASVLAIGAIMVWQQLKPAGDGALFTTDVRVATMPIESLVDAPDGDAFADGLSEWMVDKLQQLGVANESIWATAFWQTAHGALITPRDAKDALGVNRVISGSLQRYQDGHRLALELLEAETLERLDYATIDYNENDLGILQAAVVEQLAELLDSKLTKETRARFNFEATGSSDAFRDHMLGLGFLQKRALGDNLSRAIDAFESAITHDISYVGARLSLAMAKLRQCQYGDEQACDMAWEICRNNIESDSMSVSVNLAAGYVGKWTDHKEESIAAYRRVVDVEPNNVIAYRHMADNLVALDRLDEAEAAFVAVTVARPDYTEAYTNLGLFYESRDRTTEAVAQYDRVLALAPNNWWALNALGSIRVSREEWSRARGLYLRSFAIRPQCHACRNIGVLFYFEQQFDESAKYFKFALEYCDSTDANHYRQWQDWGAALYWVEGRRSESLEKFRKAVELAEAQLAERPDDMELVTYAAGSYAMIDDRERALDLLGRAEVRDDHDAYVRYVMGHAYEKLGIRESALHHVSNAVRLGYSVPQILADPLLKDLVKDIRFEQLLEISSQEGGGNGSASD